MTDAISFNVTCVTPQYRRVLLDIFNGLPWLTRYPPLRDLHFEKLSNLRILNVPTFQKIISDLLNKELFPPVIISYRVREAGALSRLVPKSYMAFIFHEMIPKCSTSSEKNGWALSRNCSQRRDLSNFVTEFSSFITLIKNIDSFLFPSSHSDAVDNTWLGMGSHTLSSDIRTGSILEGIIPLITPRRRRTRFVTYEWRHATLVVTTNPVSFPLERGKLSTEALIWVISDNLPKTMFLHIIFLCL
jgi:hypothetical protein